MLFLLFAISQAFTVRKICSYYRGAAVTIQSRPGTTGDFTDVVTVPANSCVDHSLNILNVQFKCKATVDGTEEELIQEIQTVAPTGICSSEAVFFLVPEDGTNKPTMDLSYGADECSGTDIYYHNYCYGSGTVTLTDTDPSQTHTENLAYFESLATTDLTVPSDQANYVWTGATITTAITQTVVGSDISNSPKTIHLFLYGDSGNCAGAKVEHLGQSSTTSLLTLFAVAIAVVRF